MSTPYVYKEENNNKIDTGENSGTALLSADVVSSCASELSTNFKSRNVCGSRSIHVNNKRKMLMNQLYIMSVIVWNVFVLIFYKTLKVLGILYLWNVIYLRLPLRAASRLAGRLSKMELPKKSRKPLYHLYAWVYHAKLHEAEYHDDLSRYRSFAEFFGRRLHSKARSIDPIACLVGPADGCVLSCGRIEDGHLEQVKGLFYTLHGLLGPKTWHTLSPITSSIEKKQPDAMETTNVCSDYEPCLTGNEIDSVPVYTRDSTQGTEYNGVYRWLSYWALRRSLVYATNSPSLKLEGWKYTQALLMSDPDVCEVESQRTALYHISIYLGPGDYHHFHSPTDWSVFLRRHFPGKLFSVAPSILHRLERLYCVNERVVYFGHWEHGFFACVLVGATNVGSIEVFDDPSLMTNQFTPPIIPLSSNTSVERRQKTEFKDLHFEQTLQQTKGELFGRFHIGSTIVLIFEAPVDRFQFAVNVNDRIEVGQPLATVHNLL